MQPQSLMAYRKTPKPRIPKTQPHEPTKGVSNKYKDSKTNNTS